MRELLTGPDVQRAPESRQMMMPTGLAIPRRSSGRRRVRRDCSRERSVGAAAAYGSEACDDIRAERLLERLVEVRREGISPPVVQDELSFRPARERQVDALDRLEQSRFLPGSVLEMDRPFHCGEIGVFDSRTPDLEA